MVAMSSHRRLLAVFWALNLAIALAAIAFAWR
jgi:hypothetical protein